MARTGLSKQQIFIAAKEVAAKGELPTAAKIRNLLTTGSFATIQKYLKEWKTNCFTHNQDFVKEVMAQDANQDLLAQQTLLQQALNKQIVKNEYYAQELINAEKANIVLKEENQQLEMQVQQLQIDLKKLQNINNILEQTTTEINNKLEKNDNKTIQQLQQTVDSLRAELKNINATSLAALRDASTKGHEALMQEKVISINLQAKIDSLYKELIDSKKQLNDAALKYQAQTQVLLRQINWQQRVIQEHVSQDQLRALTEEQELLLNGNGKFGAAYAK